MFKFVFLTFFLVSCGSKGPVSKEHAYNGEPLNEIAPNGLLVGHITLPKDVFPYDQAATMVYLENVRTKKVYEYGKTQGSFFLKLPAGEYVVKDFSRETCNASTGLMISNFFTQLPSNLSYLRLAFEKEPGGPLSFKIQPGVMTDIGNLLVTCFEWDARPKFKSEFAQYIQDGKLQMYKPMTYESQECGCKILRKWDGRSKIEMKAALSRP